MRFQTPDPKQTGYYLTLSQVGLEMVSPLILGVIVDTRVGTSPWGAIAGALLGLVGGLVHLVWLVQRRPPDDKKDPKQDRV